MDDLPKRKFTGGFFRGMERPGFLKFALAFLAIIVVVWGGYSIWKTFF